MPNFTPGPWHLSPGGLYVRKSDTPGWPAWNICEINSSAGQWEGNAALISTAPALYSALLDCAAALPAYAQAMHSAGYVGHAGAALLQVERLCTVLDQATRPLARSKGGDQFGQ